MIFRVFRTCLFAASLLLVLTACGGSKNDKPIPEATNTAPVVTNTAPTVTGDLIISLSGKDNQSVLKPRDLLKNASDKETDREKLQISLLMRTRGSEDGIFLVNNKANSITITPANYKGLNNEKKQVVYSYRVTDEDGNSVNTNVIISIVGIYSPINMQAFTDVNFKRCVEKSKFKAIENITSLPCPHMGIKSAEGIEQLINLTEVDLSGNGYQILLKTGSDEAIPLKPLNKLKKLNLSKLNYKLTNSSAVTEINIGKLENLESLNIKGNEITSYGFAQLKNLITLNVSECYIDSKAAISLADFNHMAKLTNFKTITLLNLSGIKLKIPRAGVLDLSNLSHLKNVDLSKISGLGKKFKFFSGIALDSLNLSGINFPQARYVEEGLLSTAGIKSIKSLDLSNNSLNGIGLADIAGLKELNLSNNKLIDIFFELDFNNKTNLHTLKSLNLSNALNNEDLLDKDFPLVMNFTELKSLESLNLSDNGVDDLIINRITTETTNSKLSVLNLSGTNITSAVDVEKFQGLTELNVSRNGNLTGIKLVGLPKLKKLTIIGSKVLSATLNALKSRYEFKLVDKIVTRYLQLDRS